MAKPKLLIASDLDYTLFNQGAPGIVWIKSKKAWRTLYEKIVDLANKSGIEVIFAVVTHKKHFDGIANEAAISFQEFLSLHNNNMYIERDNDIWCLVNSHGKLCYEAITSISSSTEGIPTEAFSHFYVSESNKSASILKIAEHYKIKPEHCILLDDNRMVLLDVLNHGIQVVSYFCFSLSNPKYTTELLKDKSYVKEHFKNNADALLKIVENIINELIITSTVNISEPKKPLTPLYESRQENAGNEHNQADELCKKTEQHHASTSVHTHGPGAPHL